MENTLRYMLSGDEDAGPELQRYDPQYTSTSKAEEELATLRLEWLKRTDPTAARNVRTLARPDGSLVINQATATVGDLDLLGVPTHLVVDEVHGLTVGLGEPPVDDAAYAEAASAYTETALTASTPTASDFKKGDVVWLKSGSPSLTVSRYGPGEDEVSVTWHSGSEFNEHAFPTACLSRTQVEI